MEQTGLVRSDFVAYERANKRWRRHNRGMSDRSARPPVTIADLVAYSDRRFRSELAETKAELASPNFWYPYDSLTNLAALEQLLTSRHRDLANLAGDRPIADIGAGDGDLAFLLARHGFTVDIVDFGPTNFNGLAGARLQADHFSTSVAVHEVDLDRQFVLPRERYGLVLCLGILYHLQNPFFALRTLAECADHLLLSTRVARTTVDGVVPLDRAPIAYLVAPTETNNDPTNYWIFSPAGLNRLFERTGWVVLDERNFGRVDGDSNPSSDDRDERMFCLLARAEHPDAVVST